MGKYGKKTKMKENLSDYSFCLLGEAGIGKTSTIAEMCEIEFGEDGYIILDLGKEQGMDALDGYAAETCETWKKFDEVIKDIIKNKDTDYPNLKVVVFDTLDQMIAIAEPEVIRRWNIENQGAKNFSQAKTLNSAWGGFGKGDDKLVEIILDKIWELKKVGVTVWYTGHVKMRNKIDAVTQEEYSVLSTDITQRVFEGFKTKMHVVGIACVDRTIEKESTGRKNIVTKQEIEVKKIKNEKRKVVFRDNNYSIDSKSRLSAIEDECLLNAEELIKVLKDAIKNSKRNKPQSEESITKKSAPVPQTIKNETEDLYDVNSYDKDIDDIESSDDDLDDIIDNEQEFDRAEVIKSIKTAYKTASAEMKKEIKDIVKSNANGKIDGLSDEDALYIYNKLGY